MVGSLRHALTVADVPHDLKLYEGARHSFFNDRGSAHDPVAAEDSSRRTLEFFSMHL
ncbi:MAG: dienelactone hydrolase family protein [Dehalococcoidia bacterium]|nr:dienelactone hydrolase family protein [Dehalococcoidia bacterium]MCA9849757.1 dienelactone hydrolase family protein [Dehalococcoidia bacterium]MCA9855681.1 dienelactone hydrolase family protein [Dehalococcoidia bacterium]